MATILGQRCTVYLDENSIQRFKIESSIDTVEPGDLPNANVFVHKIISSTDPKQDTFLRVANVADLTTLAQGRETAVGLSQTLYLSTAFTVTYDDIATATQAKPLIQQRVDNLIADWHNYNEQFLAPVSIPPNYSQIPMPLTTSEEDERKAAYTTAHAEYLAAQTDNATAQAEYAAAVTAASAAGDDAITAVAESQQCSTMLGQLNTGLSALDQLIAATTAVVNDMNPFVNSCITFNTACLTFQSAAALYSSYGTGATTGQQSIFGTAYDTWASAYGTWKNAYNNANATLTSGFSSACSIFIGSTGACDDFSGITDAHRGLTIPMTSGQVSSYASSKAIWDGKFATWYSGYLSWASTVDALVAALAAYNVNGGSVLSTVQTDMSAACTKKIGSVSAAAAAKKDADKALADAQTAKKASDQALSDAELADTNAYLAVKELCPDYERIVP